MCLYNNLRDTLVAEYQLSAGACALIRRFLELDEDIQQAFVDYAVQVANDLAQEQKALSYSPEQMWIDDPVDEA